MTHSNAMPSRTSILAAAARAFGAREPDESVRNPDWMAAQLIGPEELALIHEHPLSAALDADYGEALQNLEIFQFVLLLLMRTRFLDEFLVRGLDDGIDQFVILGAGFDTRAYRFADRLGTRKVIELDAPATQEWKQRCVKRALGRLPSHVIYAPIDFTRDRLEDALRAAGHDPSRPALYIAEGLTVYLAENAVRQTLRSVAAGSAPGSLMAIEYVSRGAVLFVQKYPTETTRCSQVWGEPYIFGVPDGQDSEFFAENGFELRRKMSLVDPETIKKYGSRQNGIRYGAHLTEALKARAQKIAATMSPEDIVLAGRFGYFLAELCRPEN